MDYIPHFRREILAFEAAVRRVAGADGAPLVPSCPGWSVSDLVAHLGAVHRYVTHIIRERFLEQPDSTDLTFLELPVDQEGWPMPEHAPNRGPVAVGLTDWFADGASALESLFTSSGPDEPVWTWSREQTTGFWLRIQTIEAAVHRWDAENAIGRPSRSRPSSRKTPSATLSRSWRRPGEPGRRRRPDRASGSGCGRPTARATGRCTSKATTSGSTRAPDPATSSWSVRHRTDVVPLAPDPRRPARRGRGGSGGARPLLRPRSTRVTVSAESCAIQSGFCHEYGWPT
jgi:uncharacterized protein (TIGR03083 family)